jgi:hypothetical protein
MLNSEADELATTGLKRLQEKLIVPLDPDAVVQFRIIRKNNNRRFQEISKGDYTTKAFAKFLLQQIRVE